MGAPPNHPKLDHFSNETYGDLGIPYFRKATLGMYPLVI